MSVGFSVSECPDRSQQKLLTVDDLQVTREQVLHQRNRPLLESLGKHSVVGVSESLLNDCRLSALLHLVSIDRTHCSTHHPTPNPQYR
jgi:hypothetical protein